MVTAATSLQHDARQTVWYNTRHPSSDSSSSPNSDSSSRSNSYSASNRTAITRSYDSGTCRACNARVICFCISACKLPLQCLRIPPSFTQHTHQMPSAVGHSWIITPQRLFVPSVACQPNHTFFSCGCRQQHSRFPVASEISPNGTAHIVPGREVSHPTMANDLRRQRQHTHCVGEHLAASIDASLPHAQ